MKNFRERMKSQFEKTKCFLDKYRSRVTQAVALVLCVTTLIHTIAGAISNNAFATLGELKQQQGTNLSLNSPLLMDDVTQEAFEEWELEVFGIFLSNFTIPLVDSMDSAFGFPGADYGTKGAGLKALKFSCGGDIASGGILQNMTRFVMDECTKSPTPLFVDYTYFVNHESVKIEDRTDSRRQATVRDLIIINSGSFDADNETMYNAITTGTNGWNLGGTELPVRTAASEDSVDVLDFGWVYSGIGKATDISGEPVLSAKPNITSLPTFYVGDNSNVVAFDFSDGWDVQIWAACINYGVYKASVLDEEEGTTDRCDTIKNVFRGPSAGDYPLYMDKIGNIVAAVDGKFIVMVPACMNKNLRADKVPNLVVAPILNDMCRAGSLDIAGAVSNDNTLTNKELSAKYGILGTGYSMDSTLDVGDESSSYPGLGYSYGNILVYNTTDFWNTWTGKIDRDRINEMMQTASVNLKQNLCISFVGGPDRKGTVFRASNGEYDKSLADASNRVIYGIQNRTDNVQVALDNDGIANLQETAQMAQMVGVAFGNDFSEEAHTGFYRADGQVQDILSNGLVAYLTGAPNSNLVDAEEKIGIAGMIIGGLGILAACVLTGGAAAVAFIAGAAVGVAGIGLVEFAEFNGGYLIKMAAALSMHYINGSYRSDRSVVDVYTNAEDIKNRVLTSNTFSEASRNLVFNTVAKDNKDSKVYDIFAQAIVDANVISAYRPKSAEVREDYFEAIKTSPLWELNELDEDFADVGLPDTCYEMADYLLHSLAVAAMPNENMNTAREYLCLANDAVFATYAPWMYVTYLKFYGFGTHKNADNVMNTQLFNALQSRISNTPEDLYDTIFGDKGITEEQKQKRVQEYTYLALAETDEGIEYRNRVMTTGIQRWIATEYHACCYGADGLGTGTGTDGFLQMSSYQENTWTSWIVANWNRVLVISMLIFIVIIVLMGVLNGKAIMWFIANILSTVLMLLILPTSGEITPYVCDKIVQGMFERGQQYWAVSEGIENDYLVQETLNGDLSEDALTLIEMAQITQTSSTLMVKHDISKKIITYGNEDIEAMMQLKSTRWMFSAIAKQISADKEEDLYSYVYTTLEDTRGKLKDTFLYYNNGTNGLYTVKYGNRDIVDPFNEAEAKSTYYGWDNVDNVWQGWTNIVEDGRYGMSVNAGATDLSTDKNIYPWQSISLSENVRNNSDHLYFGYLAELAFPTDGYNGGAGHVLEKVDGKHTEARWDALMADVAANVDTDIYGSKADWRRLAELITSKIDQSTGEGYSQSFGYLYMTEDLIPYFYLVVKDTYNYDMNVEGSVYNLEDGKTTVSKNDNLGVGSLATNLLGSGAYNTGDDAYRISAAHLVIDGPGDNDTKSYVRDVLDLEYLFNNYIPYIAEVMYITGGNNGTDGKLKELTMEDIGYGTYRKSEASWLFRCNWVIKLMSASQNAGGGVVKDSRGNEYTVEHTLFPNCYPDERPMVFSEAQMVSMGLKETDLSNIELACVRTNKETVDNWTMLINYVNVDGITRELLEEQMALEATMIFNKNIQPDNFISSEMALYPTSLDLRSVNFDAVMKLIIISDNYRATSLKQDAIYDVMNTNGTLGGLLMLFCAWMCASVLPWWRNLVLAGVFYISLISCVYNVFNDNREKAKTTGGALMTNIALTIITILYYGCFSIFITRAGGEMLLTENGFNTGSGNVMGEVIWITIASVVYFLLLLFFIIKLIRCATDMGASVWGEHFYNLRTKLSSGFRKVAGKFGHKGSKRASREKAGKDASEALGVSGGDGAKGDVVIKEGSVIIKNSKDSAIPVYLTNAHDDPTYIEAEELRKTDEDSGYIIEDKEKDKKDE